MVRNAAHAASRLVRLGALPESERRDVLRRTHALEGRIFRSVEPFEAYAVRVLDGGVSEAWVWLLEDAGELVGYNVIVYRARDYRGERIGVYNANVGLLPDYRGHNRTVATGLRLAIPRLVLEPQRRLYFHAYLMSPSIYVMMDKYSDRMWPAPRTDPPSDDVLALVEYLRSENGPPRLDQADPWVVRLPTSIDENDDEMAMWRKSDRPSVRYFFEKNPHYREGGALVLLVPLTLPNLLRAVGRVAARQVGFARPKQQRQPH
jgi:hypothetical protein